MEPRITFNQLEPMIRILRATTPARVFSTQNPDDEIDEQMNVRVDRFASLPKNIQGKLSSFEISQKIQLIGQKYNFELLRLANITRLIREYYFGEAKIENFPKEIEKRMSVSLFTAQEIARFVKSQIIDWDPLREYLANLPKAPLREALVRFPDLGEQLVTENEIRIKNFPDPVRPSIRNWLHDYTQHLGQDKHSSMQRMDFLFHSENTGKLPSPDREKLGIILKSFDDNDPLSIDPEKNEIVFEAIEKKPDLHASFPPDGVSSGKPAETHIFPSGQVSPSHVSSPNFIKPYPQAVPDKTTPPAPPAIAKFFSPPAPLSRNLSARTQPPSQKPPGQPVIKVSSPNFSTPANQSPAPAPRIDYKRPVSQIQKLPVPADAVQYENPYPDPGTHEVHLRKPDQNITNIRFTEGAPKKDLPQTKTPSAQIPPPLPSQKNIIRPHTSDAARFFAADPRIEGNLVDLSGKTSASQRQ